MEIYDERSLGPLFNQNRPNGQLKFINLGSGSSGNCYILSYGEDSIIIDAGLGIRHIMKRFKVMDVCHHKIRAIFITHDHADHSRGCIKLAYKLGVPIYLTPIVARTLLYHRNSTPDLSAYLRVTPVGKAVDIGNLCITSFEVPHDAMQNVGYNIETPSGTFTLITDIGHITPIIIKAITQANYLVFESNYDEDMLINGSYPYHLKERIRGGLGHISNKIAAKTIAKHYHQGLRFIALCHISKDNNSPELALEELRKTFRTHRIKYSSNINIHTLNRDEPQEFTLDNIIP